MALIVKRRNLRAFAPPACAAVFVSVVFAGCARAAPPHGPDPLAEPRVQSLAAYGAAMLHILDAQSLENADPRRAIEHWNAAAAALERTGYKSVSLRVGDGYAGWPEEAPFDGVMVTAAADEIPEPLLDQLSAGGRLVMPVEDATSGHQWIWLVEKNAEGEIRRKRTLPVRFVPLTGEAQEND